VDRELIVTIDGKDIKRMILPAASRQGCFAYCIAMWYSNDDQWIRNILSGWERNAKNRNNF
jgi:hypothetical protein